MLAHQMLATEVTIGQFRNLAQQRGWSEDWLVEQCRDDMDNPRETIREILVQPLLVGRDYQGFKDRKNPP